MLADPHNRACALEPRPKRVERIRANAGELGVPDLECNEARAPEPLRGCRTPMRVHRGRARHPGLGGALLAGPVPGWAAGGHQRHHGGGHGAYLTREHLGGELLRLEAARVESLRDFGGWALLRPSGRYRPPEPGRNHGGNRAGLRHARAGDAGAFAATGATLAVHLSLHRILHRIEEVVDRFLPFYGADCPAAVVLRAS